MIRLPDWQLRLETLCHARADAKFIWGQHDCCLWAADAVLAITGEDPAKDLRGTYSTALGAERVLTRFGGVETIASSALGAAVNKNFATTGDIACVELDGRKSLGVVNSATVLVTGLDRLESVSFEHICSLWKV